MGAPLGLRCSRVSHQRRLPTSTVYAVALRLPLKVPTAVPRPNSRKLPLRLMVLWALLLIQVLKLLLGVA